MHKRVLHGIRRLGATSAPRRLSQTSVPGGRPPQTRADCFSAPALTSARGSLPCSLYSLPLRFIDERCRGRVHAANVEMAQLVAHLSHIHVRCVSATELLIVGASRGGPAHQVMDCWHLHLEQCRSTGLLRRCSTLLSALHGIFTKASKLEELLCPQTYGWCSCTWARLLLHIIPVPRQLPTENFSEASEDGVFIEQFVLASFAHQGARYSMLNSRPRVDSVGRAAEPPLPA